MAGDIAWLSHRAMSRHDVEEKQNLGRSREKSFCVKVLPKDFRVPSWTRHSLVIATQHKIGRAFVNPRPHPN
jgi:hypothetical protein